ncbi:hypothetical protein [Nitrosopumilus sp. S4]
MICTCLDDEPHSCSKTKYAWFESRKERDSKPEQESSELIINLGRIVPIKFVSKYFLKIPDKELDKITDNMSDYFLEMIRKDTPKITFNILESRLKIKYMHDCHSSMILCGRKGVRIIVDHDISKSWSDINCKTEIKMFEKCGIKVSDYVIRKKVYSYVVEPNEKFYQELRKIPHQDWDNKVVVLKTISQDVLLEIEKTAIHIGLTLDDILQLMADNIYVATLRTKL